MPKKWNILVGDKDTPLVRVPETSTEVYGAPVTLNDSSGNEIGFEIEVTVDKAAGNDTALLISKIDTNSNGVSRAIDVVTDSVSVFNVDDAGTATAVAFVGPITGDQDVDDLTCATLVASGNVGIGTSDLSRPDVSLYIADPVGAGLMLYNSTAGTNEGRWHIKSAAGIFLIEARSDDGVTTISGYRIKKLTDGSGYLDYHRWNTDLGTEAMRLDTTGLIVVKDLIITTGDIKPGGAAGPVWTSGAGTPEGSVTSPVGGMYTDTGGGAGTTLYVKETGTGNTGWAAK